MENKESLKKCLIICFFISILLIIGAIIYRNYEYSIYRKNYNETLASIISKIEEYYPDIEERELIDILNGSVSSNTSTLESYGIEIDKESLIVANDDFYAKSTPIFIGLFTFSLLIITYIFIYYDWLESKKIKDIIALIEKINNKNYMLDIALTSEDELSILRTELYKTTLMLKEQAENSLNDKLSLKDSLSDISHQLKTPLTSIMISLDNLLDNPKMDETMREEFLTTIKRETSNINFLVKSLLKLSKLDTDTVTFTKKSTRLSDLISRVIANTSTLADLRNVTLTVEGDTSGSIEIDELWQTEALTNIVKNAIEHSFEGGEVKIEVEQNKLYTGLTVKNVGLPIDKKDIPHIFERFYRGKNAHPESIGIGLALSKSIITKENGSIEVDSSKEKGTTFTIKYYHR